MVESCRFGAQGSCDFLTCRTLDVFGAKSVHPEGIIPKGSSRRDVLDVSRCIQMYPDVRDVRDVRLVLDPWRWPGYF